MTLKYNGEAVRDSTPDEGEIIKALFRSRSKKSPGLTRISIDHIKEWYKTAHPKEGEGDKEALRKWKEGRKKRDWGDVAARLATLRYYTS